MKKLSIFFLLSFLSLSALVAQDQPCSNIANFGQKEICLSKVEGYHESYSNPTVKMIADGTEVPANRVLGYYLNDHTYSKIDSIGQFEFDDYFKVYGTNAIADVDADKNLLGEMEVLISKNFIADNWDTMKEEIDEVGLQMEVGIPTLINSYKVNENSFTTVLMIKYKQEDMDPYTMSMAISGLLLNDRLVWIAYYLLYENKETISSLEKKSNFIVSEILNGNKK